MSRTWYSRLKLGSSTHSGRPGLERRKRELLAEPRHEVQPPAHVVRELVEAGSGPLEDHHRAHVHVRGRTFLREEGRVHRRQPVAVLLRHGADCIASAPRPVAPFSAATLGQAGDDGGEQDRRERALVAAAGRGEVREAAAAGDACRAR